MSGTTIPKPSILATPTTSTFWAALHQRQLLLSHCVDCGHTFHYPRERCPACWGSGIRSVAASGRGTVWSSTVVHRPGHPAWQSEAPYVVALVRLEEGPVLVTNIVDAEPGRAVVGARVEAEYRASGDGVIVVFHLLMTAAAGQHD